MKRWMLLIVAVLALSGCTKRVKTEQQLFDWAKMLNIEVTSPDHNYEYPKSLDDVDPTLRLALSDTDAWGTPLFYRKLRDDRYQIISAGPNRELGDDDDVIVENGLLQKPEEVYAKLPIKN